MATTSSTPGLSANDAPGFQFIVSTPSQGHSREQKRRVRSHATRTRPRKKRSSELPSWMSRQSGSNRQIQEVDDFVASSIKSPTRVGTDISWIQFPEVMQPYMLQGIFHFFTIVKDELYPPELCLQVKSADTAWIGYMLSDQVYLHSMLYMTEAYFDQVSGRVQSMRAQYHLVKTLQLLQGRVSMPDDPLTISDATIMAIVSLALASEVLEQGENVANHMDGLQKMVSLRGGFGALQALTYELPSKISRVDLASSIRFNRRPIFFGGDISWETYLPGDKPEFCLGTPAESAIASFMQSLNPKLANVWRDLRHFSGIINLACQSERKLSPATYSEIMVSVLYRLLHYSSESIPAHEALRIAMLTFAAGIFFRWRDMKQGQEHIAQLYHRSLLQLRASGDAVPKEVKFWLLMIWHTSALRQAEDDRFDDWVSETIDSLRATSWEQARGILKSAMWIDSIHDSSGKLVWSKTMKRPV